LDAARYDRRRAAIPARPPDVTGAGAPGARDALVIRHGHVLTMDPRLGDMAGADVHIAGGRIVAIGPGLHVPGGHVLDARGMIVAPGLVDTHWHMWNTLLRSMSGGSGPGEEPGRGYFRVSIGLGRAFGPGDMYQGTRLACAEAISSGITTVHDWCHNIRGQAHAEASLRALAESGLRARFSYGYAAGHANDEPMDLAGLARLHRDWDSRGGLLALGMAWRGPGGSNPVMRVPPSVYRKEIEGARALGIPVTVHACGPLSSAGQVTALARAGLLGPDLQVVHANCATPAEIAQLAEAGAAVSVSPFTEILIGYGLPQTAEFLAAGIPTGLSIDTTALSGNADMFAIMKVTQGIANARAHDEFALTARQVLELATIEGARSLGLAGETGSLAPGKRADVILVETGSPNLGVFTDPAHMLVTAAQPANVDSVIVDGRILKRHGALVGLDPARISEEARAAVAGVCGRAPG
jgi:5-methylthioadenosine/S-adenosylhomocysteine deaminase